MKRMRLLNLVVLAGALLVSTGFAQKVSVQRIAMSPRMLGTYTGFPVSTGLRTVPNGMKVYLSADTVMAPTTTWSWTIVEKPATSAAAFSDAAARSTSLIPDVSGRYIVQIGIDGGVVGLDTLYASNYMGMPATGLSCSMCHSATNTAWKETRHAKMFTDGITGQLETETYEGKTYGVYNKTCIKCHTTGWEPAVDNGNFGSEAFKTGFDTTWYKIGRFVNNEYVIDYQDMTSWNLMNASYPTVAAVASVGCESCHGPGKEHAMNGGNKGMISVPASAGACMQCHDAPNKHRLGSYWAASNHSTMALSAGEASRSACWPCHSGSAMIDYAKNINSPDYSKTQVNTSISCVTCHDPHSDENPNQLRLVTMKPLMNGYVPPANVGGKGVLCMNCHRARVNAKDKVEAQARVFGDRFYNHYSPQGDMFLGSNAGYTYGLPIEGIGTHLHLKDGCVTCHMATRVNGSSSHSNHEMKMTDDQGNDIVTACKTCHGDITKFDDVKAYSDYDGDGVVEGAQSEVHGLMDQLHDILPKNAAGDVINMRADSVKVKADKNYPANLAAIWNYYAVKYDWSYGVHNTKYTIAILKASLGSLTGVEMKDLNTPNGFSLGQNYPNPFNPSTTVNFSVPRSADVRIDVYNSAGQLVSTIADGQLAPGTYTATFDAKNMTSGLYFYRMTATSNGQSLYTVTKKMVLAK